MKTISFKGKLYEGDPNIIERYGNLCLKIPKLFFDYENYEKYNVKDEDEEYVYCKIYENELNYIKDEYDLDEIYKELSEMDYCDINLLKILILDYEKASDYILRVILNRSVDELKILSLDILKTFDDDSFERYIVALDNLSNRYHRLLKRIYEEYLENDDIKNNPRRLRTVNRYYSFVKDYY